MQHILITGRPTYIFNYLFIYDIVVPKFKPQYHLSCQPWAIISLGLVRGFSKLVVYSIVSFRRFRATKLYIYYTLSVIYLVSAIITAECRSTISL
jgi:hypothetical protein